MKVNTYLSTLLCALFFNSAAFAAETYSYIKKSGDQTTAILELYTSEGCSSCPPAEKYLTQLNLQHSKSKSFIPLAFHVDYWDYIGWEDPYASPKHGERQRAIAIRNRLSSLYTPQFVLYGRDFPAHKNIPDAIDIINKTKPRADIVINAQLDENRLKTNISVTANEKRSQWNTSVFIAITENGLSSNITDGENQGLLMKHDHVVRHLIGPVKMNGTDKLELMENILLDQNWKLDNLALVVFAKDSTDGTTHQALKLALKQPTTKK